MLLRHAHPLNLARDILQILASNKDFARAVLNRKNVLSEKKTANIDRWRQDRRSAIQKYRERRKLLIRNAAETRLLGGAPLPQGIAEARPEALESNPSSRPNPLRHLQAAPAREMFRRLVTIKTVTRRRAGCSKTCSRWTAARSLCRARRRSRSLFNERMPALGAGKEKGCREAKEPVRTKSRSLRSQRGQFFSTATSNIRLRLLWRISKWRGRDLNDGSRLR